MGKKKSAKNGAGTAAAPEPALPASPLRERRQVAVATLPRCATNLSDATPDTRMLLEEGPLLSSHLEGFMLPEGGPLTPSPTRGGSAFAETRRSATPLHAAATPRSSSTPRSRRPDHTKNLVAGHEWATTFFAGSFGAVTMGTAMVFAYFTLQGEAFMTPLADYDMSSRAASACIAGASFFTSLRVVWGSQSCRFLRHRPTSSYDTAGSWQRQGASWCRLLALCCVLYPLAYYGSLLAQDLISDDRFTGLIEEAAAHARRFDWTWGGAQGAFWEAVRVGKQGASVVRAYHVLLLVPVLIFVAGEGALYFLRQGYLSIKAARQRFRAIERQSSGTVEGSLKRKILAHMERSSDLPQGALSDPALHPMHQPQGGAGQGRRNSADLIPAALADSINSAAKTPPLQAAPPPDPVTELLKKERKRRHYILKEEKLTLFYKSVRANITLRRLKKPAPTPPPARSLPVRLLLYFPNLLMAPFRAPAPAAAASSSSSAALPFTRSASSTLSTDQGVQTSPRMSDFSTPSTPGLPPAQANGKGKKKRN